MQWLTRLCPTSLRAGAKQLNYLLLTDETVPYKIASGTKIVAVGSALDIADWLEATESKRYAS